MTNNTNMFEKAARMKLRFEFHKNPSHGVLSVEQLWDLSVDSLDMMYKILNKEKNEISGESLLKKTTETSLVIDLKIEIIKYIVEVKIREKEEKEIIINKRKKESVIMELIEKKKMDELESKTIEELEKMLS